MATVFHIPIIVAKEKNVIFAENKQNCGRALGTVRLNHIFGGHTAIFFHGEPPGDRPGPLRDRIYLYDVIIKQINQVTGYIDT